ncbi:hypothetical protein JDV02_006019 [Purpureocillium takamizusanense]|uniref:Uncharacterized protein n=1 Tax=Purpureocillium takamizusanense TaxID=2060973 RepID=A0A9Q8QJD9_9HYPO|nr:uncharacterized protein JDV02_006019 [Purpureocillium takamizusanense]UNI19874.1 hypothetical protein JDV02_006019 [Purpureocillium takamizusanense]
MRLSHLFFVAAAATPLLAAPAPANSTATVTRRNVIKGVNKHYWQCMGMSRECTEFLTEPDRWAMRLQAWDEDKYGKVRRPDRPIAVLGYLQDEALRSKSDRKFKNGENIACYQFGGGGFCLSPWGFPKDKPMDRPGLVRGLNDLITRHDRNDLCGRKCGDVAFGEGDHAGHLTIDFSTATCKGLC